MLWTYRSDAIGLVRPDGPDVDNLDREDHDVPAHDHEASKGNAADEYRDDR